MNLEGLSISEVIEIYKKVDGNLSRDVYLNLNRYLHNRITTKVFCNDNELEKVEELKLEITRIFSDPTQEKQKSRLLGKTLVLEENSYNKLMNNVDISSFDLMMLTTFCSEIRGKRRKSNAQFKALSRYLHERIAKRRLCTKEELGSIEALIAEIERIYHGESASLRRKNLLEKIKTIVRLTKKSLYSKKMSSNKKYLDEFLQIKSDIINGNIEIESEFSLPVLASIKLPTEQLDIENKIILAVDDEGTLDLDGAFSVSFEDGCYIFDVYVTDVPSFLKDNRVVAEEVYRRGKSLYLRDFNGEKETVGMLPEILSFDYLSLLNNRPRDVIDFQYVFESDGTLDSVNIGRKQIRVTYNFNPKYVDRLLKKEIPDRFEVRDKFILLQELMGKVVATTDLKYLKYCSVTKVDEIVSFPSILTNYYLGYNSEFLIYREDAKYCAKTEDERYGHCVTPLRRFVSNINLAFYLNQIGVQSFDEKDLDFVERNIEEIIEHLNQQDMLGRFTDSYGAFVKKHLK